MDITWVFIKIMGNLFQINAIIKHLTLVKQKSPFTTDDQS